MMTYEKHGQAGRNRTTTYHSWHMMIQRCCNPKDPRFKDYGGRGIIICEEWRSSFGAFYRDMGERPEGRSLDRRDNDGPYCKANCRWATRSEQQSNSRRNRLLVFRGESRALAEWCRILKMPYRRVESRLRSGWPADLALSKPIGSSIKPQRTHCRRGHEYTAENTYTAKDGRVCRLCKAQWRARKEMAEG